QSWFVFFLELLYVCIPLLALYSASSLPHRLNRLRHYFNPIDNPIEAVPPTEPVQAPKRVRTPVEEPQLVSEVKVSLQSLDIMDELHSEREMGMVQDN
ncbi:hypothetical protein PMAYCL1PPCAC_31523, partial [Pristionchus mayeri]